MVCKFCGNEIDDNSDFCFICGQKVEPQKDSYSAEPAANVYTQPESAPAAEAFDADVAVATEEPVAFEEPVAAAPAASPATEIRSKKEIKAELKAAKKAAKAEKYAIASRAARFFSFLFFFVGLPIYFKAKKEGDEEKATVIINTMMTGLCIEMGIVIVILVKKFML